MTRECIDPRAAAGDYSAGDLTADESAAFARELAADPAQEREVAFWTGLRSRLALPEPPPPRADLAAALERRLRWDAERVRHAPSRLSRWSGVGAALAAAAGLGVVLGFWSTTATPLPAPLIAAQPAAPVTTEPGVVPPSLSAPTAPAIPVAFLDDGSAVLAPAAGGRFMPLAAIHRIGSAPSAAMDASQRAARPWLGIWSKLIEFDCGAQTLRGHLVVRICGGSPAWEADIRPGDVITRIDDCPMFTDQCIGRNIADRSPGDAVAIEVWNTSTCSTTAKRVVLGRSVE